MTADQIWQIHVALKSIRGKDDSDRATIARLERETFEHWRNAIRDETEREIRLDDDNLAEEPEKGP